MKKIIYELFQAFDPSGAPITLPADLDYSEANLATSEKEAYSGYTIEDDGQPEPEPAPSGDSIWDELDGAYQTGYEDGYTEGVNEADDQ